MFFSGLFLLFLVTLFPEKGSLAVKTTLAGEHFFGWKKPFVEKFECRRLSAASKQQQLNFHQNKSLPEEATTESIPALFYIKNQKKLGN